MAENDQKSDETTEEETSSGDGSDGFLGRFGGGFATIAGGVAAFVLMLAVGGFVAFQLLGGPGDGSAPGPVSAGSPSSSGSTSQSGSGSGDGGSAEAADLPNPDSVIEPDNQSSSEDPQPGNAPEDAQPADFELRLGKEVAEPYEDVTWSGNFPGSQGRTLMLQNKQGSSWVDFLEDATVRGNGRYEGSLSVGASGVNEFRVVDPDSGSVSNVVSIEIY